MDSNSSIFTDTWLNTSFPDSAIVCWKPNQSQVGLQTNPVRLEEVIRAFILTKLDAQSLSFLRDAARLMWSFSWLKCRPY